MKTPPNLVILRLGFAHFAAGFVLFVAALVAGLRIVPELVEAGTFRIREGWLLAHMLLPGFASLVAIGASYQIVQVVFRTPLFSRPLGWTGFAVYMCGLVLLLGGFAWQEKWVAPGGVLLAGGTLIYAVNLGITLGRAKERNAYHLGIGLSVFAFAVNGAAGILMGLQRAYGWDARWYDVLFDAHLWLGLGGWLSGLIIVFSFKLLPMFYVSGIKLPRDASAILLGFHLGIWLNWLSPLAGDREWLPVAANLLLLLSVGRFVIHVYDIRRTSRAKAPVGAVHVALQLIPLMFLGLLAAVLFDRFVEPFMLLVVLGWFAGSILAYLSKILPFLWWAYRYRTKEEKKNAPLLSDMLPERRMVVLLASYLGGIGLVATGFLAEVPVLALVGQLLAAGFALLSMMVLARVFRW